MRFSGIALAALLPTLALAANFDVMVGQNGLEFTPNQVTGVNVFDTVTFHFFPKNHSVTQSTFANPCDNTDPTSGQTGVNSGFFPVAAGAANPTFALNVSVTTPLWFFCAQTGHCQQGMVFAINPTAAKNFTTYQAAAMGAAGQNTGPAPPALSPPTTGSTGGTGNPPTISGPAGSPPPDEPVSAAPTSPSSIPGAVPVGGLSPSSSSSGAPSTATSGAESLGVGRALLVVAALGAGLLL